MDALQARVLENVVEEVRGLGALGRGVDSWREASEWRKTPSQTRPWMVIDAETLDGDNPGQLMGGSLTISPTFEI